MPSSTRKLGALELGRLTVLSVTITNRKSAVLVLVGGLGTLILLAAAHSLHSAREVGLSLTTQLAVRSAYTH